MTFKRAPSTTARSTRSLGVPYGRVTERFGRAEPAGPWQGVLNATTDGAECVQWDERQQRAIGSEQCLYLNIYTSSLPPANPTAPLVFLHGGDWTSGSGSSHWYGPRYWLDHDVVLVTLNSRLGAFGFLSTGDQQAPGNLGLHDQVLALDWINNNIAFFGGLRSLTTIMGEGTGAVSVHMLQLTQRAKNLFERAISQSGTAFCPGALVPETKDELLLMFSNELAPLYDANDPLVNEIRQILNMWVTFAKTGDPTPDVHGIDAGLWREYWEFFYPFDPHYLIIDRDWASVTELRPQAIEFWDSLGLRENMFKHKLVMRDEL
ncbi:esterase FE4-like [Pollicipes pollicipes]|uniref:esterase FE4-like n=1 Tax=Pollicipes pollicipes TaxID=41117 RepID=UPI001884F3B1|nr:esterase FE4-like [Pollicipes pollicipes]